MGGFSLIVGLRAALAPLLCLLLLIAMACMAAYAVIRLGGDFLPLHKLISKLTLGFLLLSVFPLRPYLGFSWADLGFAPKKTFFRQLAQGLLLSLLTLAPLIALLVVLDIQVWDAGRHWSAGALIGKLALALLASLFIGVGEELLFRGLLLGFLKRSIGVYPAVALTSLYFAALHFLKSDSQIPVAQQTLTSGFVLTAQAFANLANPKILDAFTSLFVIGLFLAALRLRSAHNLAICIGCHAGWVWQIKVTKDLFELNHKAGHLYLVSGYDGVIGPMVSVWLTGALILWLGFGRRGNVAES